ncbi:hypothetical protein [Streptomyces sp. NPDC020996]|uniref:hypothetical protein n=1 Tax=Streptomyces sp. NPDC020996 TaxID=3154791 RepID=UPI0033D8913C
MRRWSSVVPGRGRRSGSGTGRRGTELPADGANGTGNRGVGGPPVEDIDGVLLVRSVEDDSFPLEVVAEVAGAVGREKDVVTVIVGSAGGGAPDADLWARLGALLDSLRARGAGRVRLVMSGAGDDRPEQPCVARRIADAWELEVTAPDGAVLITPGGALFVHGDSRPGCGWWRFAPGAKPRKLGRRAPAPAWEEALGAVPERTGGCVVDRVPAGVVIRPAQAPGPAPDDLCYSVPVDFERLTVLVGAPQADDVAAGEVAAVLAGLPEAQRARARLAPGGRRDLLRLGQSVADLLATEVEVLTGLPLLDDHAPPGTPPRPTLVGLDGRPSWRPFVPSVICGPVDSNGRAPVPRPTAVHPPDWLLGGGERGTIRLTDRWQATVTRAGLALWAQDGPRPGPLGPAVDPEACAIELGMPGQPLDGSLLPALSRLLHGLGTDIRSRTTLLVRGRLLAGDGALRRLAAEHGVPNIRYVTTGRPPSPGAAAGRPVATAQPGRVSRSSGMPPHESGTAVALPTAGPGVPPPAPAARPDALQGGGAAEVRGVADGSPVAGPVAPPGPRVADGGAPGRPVAGAGVPVPPVSLRGGGPVPAPDSLLAGGAAEADADAAGPAGAVGAPPGPPPKAAEPGEAEAGAVVSGEAEAGETGPGAVVSGEAEAGETEPGAAVPTASSEPRPQARLAEGAAPVASSETGADVGSRQLASAPAASPDAGAGPGASRPRSAVASSDGVRAGADGGPGVGGPGGPGVGGAGGAGRAVGEGDGPGPDGGRAVRPEPVNRPQRQAAEPPAPHRAVLPFLPGHVSGAAERAAFRDLAAGSWEGHAAAVSRVLTRMPALRGHELEAARTDLIAAHAYLTAEEGPLHHRALIRDLHTGEGRLLPYAGCLASGLRRLPSYRGVALRGGDADGPEPAVGTLLHDPAPVSALAGASALPAGAPGRYAIWSVTGRKVRQLLDRPGGSTETYEEIVFVPGTGFRVLGVRTAPEGPSVVLLRELPGNATAYMDGSEELSGLDLRALAHLEEALAKGFRAGDVPQWPERCSGPVGQDG